MPRIITFVCPKEARFEKIAVLFATVSIQQQRATITVQPEDFMWDPTASEILIAPAREFIRTYKPSKELFSGGYQAGMHTADRERIRDIRVSIQAESENKRVWDLVEQLVCNCLEVFPHMEPERSSVQLTMAEKSYRLNSWHANLSDPNGRFKWV